MNICAHCGEPVAPSDYFCRKCFGPEEEDIFKAVEPAPVRKESTAVERDVEEEDEFLGEQDEARRAELARKYRIRIPDDLTDKEVVEVVERIILDPLPDRDAAYDIEEAINRVPMPEDADEAAVRRVMNDRLAELVELTGGHHVILYPGEEWKDGKIILKAIPAEDLDRPLEEREAVPIPVEHLDRGITPGEGVAQGLLLDGQIVTFVGEEGEGKSTLGWQIACQLASGQDIGGHFEVKEPVKPVLIVDVEQSQEDALILRNDMIARGLEVNGVYWLDAQGRAFDTVEDQKWLTAQVRGLRPQVIIFDTATDGVSKAREDESVKPLFVKLNNFLKNEGVRTVILLAQPRKRGLGEPLPRSFDDLFGSRVWKGRSSAVLYLEGSKLTVWKQRGGYIRRRWGVTEGRVEGRYLRYPDGPARILGPQPEIEAERERREAIVATVQQNPGQYSKTSLVEEGLNLSSRVRPAWARSVDALLAEGVLVVEGRFRRLYVGTTSTTSRLPPENAGGTTSSTKAI